MIVLDNMGAGFPAEWMLDLARHALLGRDNRGDSPAGTACCTRLHAPARETEATDCRRKRLEEFAPWSRCDIGKRQGQNHHRNYGLADIPERRGDKRRQQPHAPTPQMARQVKREGDHRELSAVGARHCLARHSWIRVRRNWTTHLVAPVLFARVWSTPLGPPVSTGGRFRRALHNSEAQSESRVPSF